MVDSRDHFTVSSYPRNRNLYLRERICAALRTGMDISTLRLFAEKLRDLQMGVVRGEEGFKLFLSLINNVISWRKLLRFHDIRVLVEIGFVIAHKLCRTESLDSRFVSIERHSPSVIESAPIQKCLI